MVTRSTIPLPWSTPFPMSSGARSRRPAEPAELDRAASDVRSHADEFARLPVRAKVALLRALPEKILAVAGPWVEAGCRAKGIPAGTPTVGEEWLVGPALTVRNVRLLADSLEEIDRRGKPPLGRGAHIRPDGRIAIRVFPSSLMEAGLFAGFSAEALMQEGMTEEEVRERQASFYQRSHPVGRVTVVLGAGNASSIPPADVLYKMFADGHVCVLKMNPVNEWVGPFLEQAFSSLVDRGFLRIVYGGGEVGAYLVEHPQVDDVHITGSQGTHDLIVWGPPGSEREERKAAGSPVLKKTITSELGNVSPVAIVPADYTDGELWFQARNVASMVVNNASFNCNAAKVLIAAKGWNQREKFLGMLARALTLAPSRKAYYPGAHERYLELTKGRKSIERLGAAREGELPWTLLCGLDPNDKSEKLFQVEPFCSILSETAIHSDDPIEFLEAATRFCNERLWGTLNAALIVHPRLEKEPAVQQALDRAILGLRYGTVAVNHWPAVGYGLITPPWGGHPSSTLADIQSGLGWVHNTFLLEGIEKTVVRGPLVVKPKPAWFYDNRRMRELGEKLARFEASPSWRKIPGMMVTALSESFAPAGARQRY